MSTCLITGADGFIGRALCLYLLEQGYTVHGTVRKAGFFPAMAQQRFHLYTTGSIDYHTQWHDALQQVDTVVHLAGTVHRPDIQDPIIYQRSIVEATDNLVTQAIAAGVKRLVYISSSHVYGVNASTTPIAETHPCHPQTPYAQAKWQAEQILQQRMQQNALEIVIIRPPLVYGAGVRGHFAQLIQLVKICPCLPLGRATQLRSLVGLDNLIAFLFRCMEHPQAANTIWNISDDHDISTRELCEKIARALHKNRLFLPLPAGMMQRCLKWLGQAAMYDKLFAAMQLDIQRAKNKLDWQAPWRVDEQLGRALNKSPSGGKKENC